MDDENEQQEGEQKKFAADRAKIGRAGCKKCKQKIETGSLRIAKVAPNPFGSGGGNMKMWHHVSCIFEAFSRQRATTARIESGDDLEGWDALTPEDQEEILSHVTKLTGAVKQAKPKTPKAGKAKPLTPSKAATSTIAAPASSTVANIVSSANTTDKMHKDNSFREFRRLCADIANASSYLTKTSIVRDFFTKGAGGDGFRGDVLLWCRLLLPGAVKRVYNLQSKQIIKLLSRLFKTDQESMLEDLEQGDVAETVRVFFEQSNHVQPAKKSLLTLYEVDQFLEQLAKLTKEEDQLYHFHQIANKCTSNDLKMIIRLVKHDLRINAGPKHILEGIHPDAYQAFQTTRDISSVVTSVVPTMTQPGVKQESLNIGVKTLTPVLPMLAEACKSVEQAMRKCPNGMYAEIKYDGERVQVHKQGNEFKFFSRSLKPVLPHKVSHLREYIPQAFPYGNDLILDSEILMIDLRTGQPLPFGSLGAHKKNEFHDANVCLFVFDCIYYNGESLLKKPMKERRRILEENMREIKNHVVFSEQQEIHEPKELEAKMTEVFRLGLEGLVLKDLMGVYSPGKRHWLKVKKDYLMDGAMADSADLIVLGAWYGTGQKGGMMSVFLMGCYDGYSRQFRTVTKVHTGHDDKTLERLQTELDMVKISKDPSKVPLWLDCTKTMIPDFVARDPKAQPVWEITGAEFTKHEVHTATGISIRFPRVTRIRSDKTWQTATSLSELQELYKTSKDTSDFTLAPSSTASSTTSTAASPASSPRKRPSTPSSPSPRKRRAVDESPSSAGTTSPVKGKVKRTTVVARDEDAPSSPPSKRPRALKHPLLDVFVGVRLFLPEEVVDSRDVLERYFVAFGGDLLQANNADEATHTIVTSRKVKPLSGVAVNVSWLWDSIKLQRLQTPGHYSRTL